MLSPFRRSWNGFGAQPASSGGPNPEVDLTQTGAFEIGDLPGLDPDTRRAPVVLVADFTGLNPNGPGGLIAEFGGASAGVYLGFDRTGTLDGGLVFRFGDGEERWGPSTWYGVYDKSHFWGDGTLIAEIAFTSQAPSFGRIFWRGAEIAPVVTSGPLSNLSFWSGSGSGEYLATSSSVPKDEDATPVSFITASPMRSYANQVVAI